MSVHYVIENIVQIPMELKMTDEMFMDQISCNEMDLFTILGTARYNLSNVESNRDKKALEKIMREVHSVIENQSGEGVYSFIDGEHRLVSTISQGKAIYFYSTDLDDKAVMHGECYRDLALDIIGLLKDMVVTNVRLYNRRNWNNKCGDPSLDLSEIRYRVGSEIYSVQDKDELARLFDTKNKDVSINEYISFISSATLLVDKEVKCDQPLIYVITQDRLDGRVTGMEFKSIEDSVDCILNNVLLEVYYIDKTK